MFRSKNYKESAKLIDKSVLYDAQDAFKLVCDASKAKFDETVELHVKLGVDGRHADHVRKCVLDFLQDIDTNQVRDIGHFFHSCFHYTTFPKDRKKDLS